jgi:hypothetical protein
LHFHQTKTHQTTKKIKKKKKKKSVTPSLSDPPTPSMKTNKGFHRERGILTCVILGTHGTPVFSESRVQIEKVMLNYP